MTRPTIISLSTIPTRFPLIIPTLKSLLSQSLKTDEIRLYIPITYRRFPQWDGALPKVPSGITIHRCDKDYGPATKVLPAALDLKGRDVDILFCDDDNIYDKHWHQRLKVASVCKPHACIVEMGDNLPDIGIECRSLDRLPLGRNTNRDWKYRLKRLSKLNLLKPNLTTEGYVDMLAGFAGVLVRPDYFDDPFFEIPDVMWTVDDPWISGHLERQGIPIWMTGKGYRMLDVGPGLVDSLTSLVEADHDRLRADLLVIDYFREKYGIWEKCGTVDDTAPYRSASVIELARRRVSELAS